MASSGPSGSSSKVVKPASTEKLPSFSESFGRTIDEYESVAGPSTAALPSPATSAYSTASSKARDLEDDYDSDATISDPGDGDVDDTDPTEVPATPKSLCGDHSRPKCAFQADCHLNSPTRPVISHYFGRNKKETRNIPKHIWLNYCRQHYQRSKYRLNPDKYAVQQMQLVKSTVRNLENWGGVTDFDVSLRKRVRTLIAREDAAAASAAKKGGKYAVSPPSAVKERWMLTYCGKGKTFQEVYALVDAVIRHCGQYLVPAPEFEIVPSIKPQFMNRANSTTKRSGKTPKRPSPPPLTSRRTA